MAAKRDGAMILFVALSCAAMVASGCAARKRPTIPWGTAVLVRPVAAERAAPTTDIRDIVPDLGLLIPPPPAPLAVAQISPARPRSAAPTTNQNAPAVKPDTPQIVPELSAQESISLQRETNQSLSAAERNLASVAGKSLNAAQSDLASKVRSFISGAREAGRTGDWAQARDLAQKAQVLSEELAASL